MDDSSGAKDGAFRSRMNWHDIHARNSCLFRGAAAVLAWQGFTFLQNWLMLDQTQYKVYLKREVPYAGVKADTPASSAGTGFSCNVNTHLTDALTL